MAQIAVLGLGAMGFRVATHLIHKGYTLKLWDSTSHTIQPLLDAGAILADTPRDAVQGSDIVISMVKDDHASRAVWLDAKQGVLTALQPTTIAIESSTLTPACVMELAIAIQGRGAHFLGEFRF